MRKSEKSTNNANSNSHSVAFRLKNELYAKIKNQAETENRTVTNMIETILKTYYDNK